MVINQTKALTEALYEAHLVMKGELHTSNASSLSLQIITWCKAGMGQSSSPSTNFFAQCEAAARTFGLIEKLKDCSKAKGVVING